MHLNDYLQSLSRTEIDALAQAVGTKPVYLRQVSKCFRRPSITLALKLEHATHGVLMARELRPDLPWPDPHSARTEPLASFPDAV